MKSNCKNSLPPEAGELYSQISALENQFAELFMDGGNRDKLTRIHVQLKVLKMELQLQEGGAHKPC